MRQEKNGVRYFSFQELPDAPKHEKPTVGKKRQEKFVGICKFCKTPLKYIQNTNVIVCTNEKCRKKKNDDGENKKNVYRLLDDDGLDIALSLFDVK